MVPITRALFNLPGIGLCRRYVTTPLTDPRSQLRNEIKEAMKNRDRDTSTTLRSVMSEIDSAAKNSKHELTNSDIVRRGYSNAVQRRADAAKIFNQAKRGDLAEKELKEAGLLSKFVPPLLSVDDIDANIKAILANSPTITDPRKALPNIFKEFYARVDKSLVDRNLVKERAQELLALQTKP